MEHRLYIGNSESLATALEYGTLKKRHNILRKMTSSGRFCETVIISLRAMTLFNEDRKCYDGKK